MSISIRGRSVSPMMQNSAQIFAANEFQRWRRTARVNYCWWSRIFSATPSCALNTLRRCRAQESRSCVSSKLQWHHLIILYLCVYAHIVIEVLRARLMSLFPPAPRARSCPSLSARSWHVHAPAPIDSACTPPQLWSNRHHHHHHKLRIMLQITNQIDLLEIVTLGCTAIW